MDSSMFQGNHFIDATGAVIPQSQVIATSIRDGRNVTSIITPKVIEVVQRHFNCSSVQGAELEDDGGSGTAGSHWEQRVFEGPARPHLALLSRLPPMHAAPTTQRSCVDVDLQWRSV